MLGQCLCGTVTHRNDVLDQFAEKLRPGSLLISRFRRPERTISSSSIHCCIIRIRFMLKNPARVPGLLLTRKASLSGVSAYLSPLFFNNSRPRSAFMIARKPRNKRQNAIDGGRTGPVKNRFLRHSLGTRSDSRSIDATLGNVHHASRRNAHALLRHHFPSTIALTTRTSWLVPALLGGLRLVNADRISSRAFRPSDGADARPRRAENFA